jgi:hypothetical protein
MVQKCRRYPVIVLGFHREESLLSKKNAFNEAIAENDQLRLDLGFSPKNVGL